MGAEGYSRLGAAIRPMAADEIAAAYAVVDTALGVAVRTPGLDDAARLARGAALVAHLLTRDPGGCWVAEHEGRPAGVAIALLRDGLWGLSLFAMSDELRGRGVGRALLDRALAYGAGARGGLIVSSEDPRAMRRYARAGFALRPCVAAGGIVRPDRLAPAVGVTSGDPTDPALVAVSRAVRGAAHGDDVAFFVEHGSRLLVLADRGFVVHDAGRPRLLAARDDDAAATLLRAALLAAPPGATVMVHPIAAGQDWAVRTCLDAGLSLSAEGPVFAQGDVGPLRPYLPSGAFL